jgi:hypothetical protein
MIAITIVAALGWIAALVALYELWRLSRRVGAYVVKSLGDATHPFVLERQGDELPDQDRWPEGFKPAGAEHEVLVTNGTGGVLKLRVRDHAFRVVSFSRPTKFDPVTGDGDTVDLWLDVEQLVEKVKQPWTG